MIFSALLTRIKDVGKNLQIKYLFKPKDSARNLNPYGFFSNPPKGSKVVCLKDKFGSVYGIAYLDSVIPSLEANEAIVGNFVIGSIIKFDKEGNIDITPASGKNVTINGNLIVTGTINSGAIVSTGTLTATDASLGGKSFNAHIHSGVTVGAGNTGGIV